MLHASSPEAEGSVAAGHPEVTLHDDAPNYKRFPARTVEDPQQDFLSSRGSTPHRRIIYAINVMMRAQLYRTMLDAGDIKDVQYNAQKNAQQG